MPLYPHTTFSTIITNPDGSTSGVPIPDPQYTDAEKDIIQSVIDGDSLFDNPVEDNIIKAASLILTVTNRLVYLSTPDIVPPRPLADLNLTTLIQRLSTDTTSLRQKFVTGGSFRRHTARISGALDGQFYDQPDGDYYGFTALTSIASAYNSAKDALRSEEDPVEDNYSIHFTSILDSGQRMMEDIIAYFGGDGLSIRGLNLGYPDLDSLEIESQGQIDTISADILEFINSVNSLINRDNKAFEDSFTFLEKYARGNTILGMNKDQYFGGVLLDSVATDDLKAKLDGVTSYYT